MIERQNANRVYDVYAKLPASIRRAGLAVIPPSWRARVRHWAKGEAKIIEAEIRRLDGTPWRDFRSGLSTSGTTERVVEYPWILSRYTGERRVLDAGTANAFPAYVRGLRGLGIPELHGVDLIPATIKGISMTQADIRQMPFDDGFFDQIFCVSTLEHIGQDTTSQGIESRLDVDGSVEALREMRRVVKVDGRVLVTVPFGKPQEHGWFRQYDLASWNKTLELAGLSALEVAFYGYSPQGWSPFADGRALELADYRAKGAQAATAVLCSVLCRSSDPR